MWASTGGEGAKFWLGVLTEIKNRGVADVCIVVCDGLNGLPDAIADVAASDRPDLRLASDPQHVPARVTSNWDAMAPRPKPVYTAATEARTQERFDEFAASLG